MIIPGVLSRSAAQAARELERGLGISTATATDAPPVTLDEAAFKEMLAALTSADQNNQEYLIGLLALCGFTVAINNYIERPIVFLPEKYKKALAVVHERLKANGAVC